MPTCISSRSPSFSVQKQTKTHWNFPAAPCGNIYPHFILIAIGNTWISNMQLFLYSIFTSKWMAFSLHIGMAFTHVTYLCTANCFMSKRQVLHLQNMLRTLSSFATLSASNNASLIMVFIPVPGSLAPITVENFWHVFTEGFRIQALYACLMNANILMSREDKLRLWWNTILSSKVVAIVSSRKLY